MTLTTAVPKVELEHLSDRAPMLRELRRRIHQHPELGYEEEATSSMVASLLQEWGWEVTRSVGGTGVVAVMQAGKGLRRIGLRADMDALPIQEVSGQPWASQNAGVMHACGHDGHTAMLLGAAWHLARTRAFDGTVALIFQPAEELGAHGGAQRMLADGLFKRFPCDIVFAAHNHPGAPAGHFLIRRGPFMAASDQVSIRIIGQGGHAARPHLTVDTTLVAASLVVALQSVVARNVNPLDSAVLTVGALQSGKAANVIPGHAALELSVRSFDPKVRELLRQRIHELTTSHVQGYGARAEVQFLDGTPMVVNDNRAAALAERVAVALVGRDRVDGQAPLQMGGEDFAHMLMACPGALVRIGNGCDQGQPMLHDPRYDFNDAILCTGAAFWARLAQTYLADGMGADAN